MQEIELKFLIPNGKLDIIKSQTHIKSSLTNKLAAYYFDTPTQLLSQHDIALRIRKEGDKWVQTVKGKGDGLASRIEHNHILDNDNVNAAINTNQLMPNLAIYLDIPIVTLFQKFDMEKLNKQLTCQYITDVDRTTRLIKKDGQIIEVAFDTGKVFHGTDNTMFQPIHELELELTNGHKAFLFQTAKTWCKRYNLCLSTISKAERGTLVVANKLHSKATKANLKAINVHKNMSCSLFIRSATHNCLLQIMPNASAILGGSKDIHHVRQLCVGISRLRTVLSVFKKFSNDVNPEWNKTLTQAFKLLDKYHHIELIKKNTQPMLESIGAPAIQFLDQFKLNTMPIDTVQTNDFQIVLLELIEFALSDANSVTESKSTLKPARPKINTILDKLFDKICTTSIHVTESDIDAHHDINNKLKSLRYISEFVAPMYNKKQAHKFVKQLKPCQKILNSHNNCCVDYAYYLNYSTVDANAYFAVGWLLASKQQSAKICTNYLKRIPDAPIYW